MKKRFFAAILCAVMIVSWGLSLVGCTPDSNDNNTPTPEEPTNYTVRITTEYGLPISGLSFIIHDEASGSPNSSVARLETDRNGFASAVLDPSKVYSVKILYPDAGFHPEEKYLFNSERHADVKVKTAPIDGGFEDFDGYMLGDVVHNFQLTDINGNKYTVADVLSENKLLVLNFWFVGCGPCRSEFPTFISTYEKYRDKGVEFFAINDNGDPIGTIRDYRIDYKGASTALPFPVFKAEVSGFGRCELISAFGGTVYPYTVFIDRAGIICYVHEGVMPSLILESIIKSMSGEYYTTRLGEDILGVYR